MCKYKWSALYFMMHSGLNKIKSFFRPQQFFFKSKRFLEILATIFRKLLLLHEQIKVEKKIAEIEHSGKLCP